MRRGPHRPHTRVTEPVTLPSLPTLATVERVHIIAVFTLCDGNRSRAARVLDVSRATLINKLRAYGMGETRSEWDARNKAAADHRQLIASTNWVHVQPREGVA